MNLVLVLRAGSFVEKEFGQGSTGRLERNKWKGRNEQSPVHRGTVGQARCQTRSAHGLLMAAGREHRSV